MQNCVHEFQSPHKKQSSLHNLSLRREEILIAKKSVPLSVIVHAPQTEEGKLALARQVAEVHADFVDQTIRKLSCPAEQKLRLLDAVIHLHGLTEHDL